MNRYSLRLRGDRHEWNVRVYARSEWVEAWRNDGLVVDEVLNVIPEWWVDWGLPVDVWCFFEDLFNLRNPYR